MPHSVEMPAPVKGTMVEACAIRSPTRSTPLRRSGAIMGISESLAAPVIARPFGMHLPCENAVGNHNPATPCPHSRPNRDRQCGWDTNRKKDRHERTRKENRARARRNRGAHCKLQGNAGKMRARAREVFCHHAGKCAPPGKCPQLTTPYSAFKAERLDTGICPLSV